MERAKIIEKLRTLKVGDYLIGTGEGVRYKKGKKYYIEEDNDNDKYVVDETKDHEYLNYGTDYDIDILERVARGQLLLVDNNPSYFNVTSIDIDYCYRNYVVTVNTDAKGYERLKQLESEVKKASEIATLERQRDEIQRKIDELKANGPK